MTSSIVYKQQTENSGTENVKIAWKWENDPDNILLITIRYSNFRLAIWLLIEKRDILKFNIFLSKVSQDNSWCLMKVYWYKIYNSEMFPQLLMSWTLQLALLACYAAK